MNQKFDDQLPLGFSMGLAMNVNALNSYAGLSDEQKQEVINKAKNAKSKSEMQKIIDSIPSRTTL